jgi:hypothetical protein
MCLCAYKDGAGPLSAVRIGRNWKSTLIGFLLTIFVMSMIPQTPHRKDGRFYVRMEKTEIDRLRRIARSRGLTMAELIRYRLRNQDLPDRTFEQQAMEALEPITRELQQIGHNLNQATAALHRANLRMQPIGPELARFNQLLGAYLGTREALRTVLEKIPGG